MRMPAVVIGWDIAGDHHHRNRVQRGIRNAGRGIGQAGAQVRQQNARLSGGACISISGVRGCLFMPGCDEAYLGVLAECIQDGNYGVSAQPKYDLNPHKFEVVNQLIGRNAIPLLWSRRPDTGQNMTVGLYRGNRRRHSSLYS